MGYTQKGSLAEDLFPARFVPDTAETIADEVADTWRDAVAKRTPTARPPEAYHADFQAWIEDRGGRLPRTMRDSWRRSKVTREGNIITVEVYSAEPADAAGRQKVDLVEEDTRPHLIRAKRAKALRFPVGPVFRYAVEVWHPGTQGVHMMRDAEAEMDLRWEQVAERVISRKEDEYNAL